MLVLFALGNAKVLSFALGNSKLPDASSFALQWNIGFYALQGDGIYMQRVPQGHGACLG